MKHDSFFIERAIELARKGFPRATPNPLVGCVLAKNGKAVAEGFHKTFGGHHAEIVALRKAGKEARGATAFINLEPCSYWGKTPPCVSALIKAGIRSVVAAMPDPNPKVRGRGLKSLQKAGISVRVGVLKEKALELNLPFWTQMTKNRPYIVLKTAMTLDGKTTDYQDKSQWITSRQSRKILWKTRSLFDAVLVGIKTVHKDNPELTSHGYGRNPARVVLDPRLTINPNARILNTKAARTIVVTSAKNDKKFEALSRKDVEILTVGATGASFDLKEIMRLLSIKSIQTLLVEGGSVTHGHFVQNSLADAILWFIAPKILGGAAAKSPVEGKGLALNNALAVKNITLLNQNPEQLFSLPLDGGQGLRPYLRPRSSAERGGGQGGGDIILRGSLREDGLKWPLLEI